MEQRDSAGTRGRGAFGCEDWGRLRSALVLVALGLVACGDDGGTQPDAALADGGPMDVDGGAIVDGGRADAGVSDGGADDGGIADGGIADGGADAGGSTDAGADGGPLCDDGDDDGVCDDEDVCSGFDDGVDADADGTPAGCDCDDGDDTVHPGATEVCNGVDDDCDPGTEEPAAILRGGVPQGDLAVAIGMGGVIEICGAFPLRRAGLPRLSSSVTVRGLSADAEILYESGRLDFDSGVDAAFESLAITADVSAGLSGVHVIDADLVLTDVTIDGLQTAILADRATVDMTRGRIAGSREDAGVYLDRSTATFTNVLFEDNETRDSSRGGGALFASLGSTVTLTGCTLHDNRNALGVGGAVYLGEAPSQDWGSARLTATGCDWGSAGSDNAPDDLVLWYGPGTSGLIVDAVTTDVSCVANSSGNSCTPL